MKGFLRLLAGSLAAVIIIVAALGAAGYWLYRDLNRPGPLTAERTLIVPAHSGVAAIATLLADKGAIRHKLSFEIAARLSAESAKLKAGEYAFPARVSVLDAIAVLAAGRTVQHRLTIPEGLTSPQIVALVRAAAELAGDPGPVPPEGTLLPETYIYSYGDQRRALIERMTTAMTRELASEWAARSPELPLATPRDAVILASIVEKETAKPDERAHVAAVFFNRLRLGMPLQSDPTVLYALSHDGTIRLDRPLSRVDLAVASPYNTYLDKGLPPGPIDNPGKASLRAVMRPERADDLYFVADGSGGHAFARTLAEHDRNVARYRALTEPAAPASAPAAAAPAAAPSTPVAAPPPPKPPRQAARERRCGHGSARGCGR